MNAVQHGRLRVWLPVFTAAWLHGCAAVTTTGLDSADTVQVLPAKDREPTVFEFPNQNILFKVKIADREIWAALDTGATRSLLSIELARTVGLTVDPRQHSIQTLRGTVTTQSVTDVSVLIPGQFEARFSRLAVADIGAASTIAGRRVEFVLGQDLLRSTILLVDPDSRTLQLLTHDVFRAPPASTLINLKNSRPPQAEIRVGAERALVTIDTGFNGQVSLPSADWARIVPANAPLGTTMTMGGDGKLYASRSAMLSNLELGPIQISDVIISDSAAQKNAGLLGMRILARYRFALDLRTGRLWLSAHDCSTQPAAVSCAT